MDLLEQMFRLYNRPAKNVVNLLWDMQITKLSAAQGATTLLVGDLGNFTISYHGDHALNSLLREGWILELLQQLTYQQRGLSNRARLHIIYNMLTPLAARQASKPSRIGSTKTQREYFSGAKDQSRPFRSPRTAGILPPAGAHTQYDYAPRRKQAMAQKGTYSTRRRRILQRTTSAGWG